MAGWFSLEAVYAKKGDALILHFGSARNPRWMLIDGGHNGVYKSFLRPRLEQHRLSQAPDGEEENYKLPLDIVMISHADADHIKGVLDLLAEERNARGRGSPVQIEEIWFNGFSDLIAQEDAVEQTSQVLENMIGALDIGGSAFPGQLLQDRNTKAVVASTRQGRQLQDDASALAIPINEVANHGLIMRGGDNDDIIRHRRSLKITVIGPDRLRVERFRRKWRKDLEDILEGASDAADALAFNDSSAFNLASLMLLVERNRKSMLLTGDGRGDHLMLGLEDAGLLDQDGHIHVDLFKIPHHGSDNNVEPSTFENITAKHYVISGNGEHGNPEPAMLDMLVEGRGRTRNDDYAVYFTFPARAFEAITEEQANRSTKRRKQKEALKRIHDWSVEHKPDNMEMVFRERNALSIAVDLEAEQVPDA